MLEWKMCREEKDDFERYTQRAGPGYLKMKTRLRPRWRTTPPPGPRPIWPQFQPTRTRHIPTWHRFPERSSRRRLTLVPAFLFPVLLRRGTFFSGTAARKELFSATRAFPVYKQNRYHDEQSVFDIITTQRILV